MRLISTDPLLRGGLILALAMAGLHGSNWLYHVVMSRSLGPADYGGLSALLGLLFILTVPATAIQMGVSAYVTRQIGDPDRSFPTSALSRWLNGFLLLGVASSVVALVFGSSLAAWLRLESPAPGIIAGTALISWLPLPVMRGLLQGSGRLWALGGSLASEGVLKLGTGVLLVSLGFGLSGAVAAVSVGSLGALAVTMRWWGGWSPWRQVGADPDDIALLRLLLPYGAAAAAFTLLTQADVVLVKTLFPPVEAGVYAAAATGGKIILYLTAPLAMVMLPEVVGRQTRHQDARPVVLRGAAYAAGAGGVLLAAYVLVPGQVMRLLFGGAYLDGAPLLSLIGAGMLASELAVLGVYYLLAMNQVAVLRWIAVQAMLFPVVLLTFAHTLPMVAGFVALVGFLAFTGVWWPLVRRPPAALRPQEQAS